MDIKHILEKIKQIESKQTLMESPEKPRESSKVVEQTTTQINESTSNSIYATLVREFGYSLNEADTASLTPDQQQKLGGADSQDPYIVARNLGKDAVPISYFTNPEDQKIARQLGFKDTAAGVAPAAADFQKTDKDTTPVAEPDGGVAPAAAVPPGINPETGEKYTSVADAPLELPPGAEPEPGINVAGGANAPAAAKPTSGAAQPAKPAAGGGYTIKPGDNLTKIAKANGTTVDAIMKANPQIKDPNKIAAGAKLNLPGGATQPAGSDAGAGRSGSAYAAQDPRRLDQPNQTANTAAKTGATAPQPSTGQKGPTKAAAAGQDPSNPLNKPVAGAAQPATAGQTTNSSSRQNVSGTLKMGKPEGPIQFNGKTVQPGDPQYAAASQALIQSQQRAQQARTQLATRGAANAGPITQGGVASPEFEESLSRIRHLAGM